MAQAGADAPGSMAAILKLEDEQVAALCSQAAAESGDVVQVANYNSPGQVVISGGTAGVAAATALVKAAGGRAMPLAVSIAAHSALMAPAAKEFAEWVAGTPIRAPHTPVIGNVERRAADDRRRDPCRARGPTDRARALDGVDPPDDRRRRDPLR